MSNSDCLSLIDGICRLYHPSLSFPISLDTLSNDKNSQNLFQIGNSLDYELSTSHLSRPNMILIISNGPNGKELVNYLYKELVFTDTKENKNNEYYYVCPLRSQSDYNKSGLFFITKNLNSNQKDKIHDRIQTLRVATGEDTMNMISTFLVQISNASSLSVTNALIDTVIQNKANKIFIILNPSVVNTSEMLYYEDIIVSIVESGYIRKLNLFVNYNNQSNHNNSLNGEYSTENDDKLNELNSRLQNLFQNKECAHMVKDLRYSWISFPRDVRLIEHLLGVEDNHLQSFSNYLSNLNGSVQDLLKENTPSPTTTTTATSNTTTTTSVTSNKDPTIAMLKDTLTNINTAKVNYSISKLQSDLQSLNDINNKIINESRNKLRKNNFVTFLKYFKTFHSYLVLLFFTVGILLHVVTSNWFTALLLRIQFERVESLNLLKNWTSKYERRQWILVYLVVLVCYVSFEFLSNKFLLTQEFDKEKFILHKNYSKHLSEVKVKLNEIKRNLN